MRRGLLTVTMKYSAWGLTKVLSGLLMLVWLIACTPPQATQALISIAIAVDNQEIDVQLSAGSTVQQALDLAGVNLGPLDRLEPAAYTLLTDGSRISIIRVNEKFEIERVIIPFEQLRQPTELLPEGVEQLDPQQQGENGEQELTFRVVYEDEVEISRTAIKSTIIKDPQPQIILVGVKPLATPITIPGRLVYLYNGDAWLMEQTTTNRRPVVTATNMDGRVFNLSQDGAWLLFTQHADNENQINTLWVGDIASDTQQLIDLKVSNVIHFADWIPGSNSKIVFSTVEPRTTAPGWQANNDLNVLTFSSTGWVSSWQDSPVLEANSGGVYGWWGTNFSWAPDAEYLSYARPDSVGLLDYASGIITTTLEISPLQTRGEWAWVPGFTWGPDGSVLYTVSHLPPEDSQLFDLMAVTLWGGSPITLVPQAGMFSYPVASPVQERATSELFYQVAYLQAIFPTQSETSRYRLAVMDRDGSNKRFIFPPEGELGLEPQNVVWSPAPIAESGGYGIALVYQGNLWIVDATSGEGQQITGDGLVNKIAWILP